MHRLKQLVRRSLANTLYYSGALWLYAHLLARNRVVVLTYHRVLPSDRAAASFSSPAIVVTPSTFAMHMETVKRWFTPLNASAFAAHSGGRGCLVTFDDGWYDNHAYALPVLERTGVPMLLFVATNYIGSSDCFWQETLAAHLYAARGTHGNGEARLVFDEIRGARARPPRRRGSPARGTGRRRPREGAQAQSRTSPPSKARGRAGDRDFIEPRGPFPHARRAAQAHHQPAASRSARIP